MRTSGRGAVIAGAAGLSLMALAGLAAPVLRPVDPYRPDLTARLEPPSRARGGGPRRATRAGGVATHPAPRRPDAARAGDIRDVRRHRRGGEPRLPRTRRTAAATLVGRDARRGATLPARGTSSDARSRRSAGAQRAGIAAARRRPA